MTIDDAAKIALALPDVTEGTRWGNRTWLVAGKGFAWERPLSKADVRRLGKEPVPEGPLLAVRVANLEEKEVLMMDPPEGFFDIEHFSGYPAVLVRLAAVKPRLLKAAITEAWRVCAGA
ncbi:MAG TPA: MmcQ/YjbR family DNA-binding protein [Candidatus Dormibacteraeota bacterium]